MKKPTDNLNAEQIRLKEDLEKNAHWRRWGPYLSERQWGTVREDYSPHGTTWEFFPHDHARSRVYRWGEDGLLGISDNHQRLCFSLSLWNGKDPILKERLFGLTGKEGNHGEDVKEYYFYLDSTPTHSYMKALYKYPHAAFPYAQLVEENRRRDRQSPEYELIDTGVFNENRYFDVEIEYAKKSSDDILIQITAANRGPEKAVLDLLPTLWFRNTWSWGRNPYKPSLSIEKNSSSSLIRAEHEDLGPQWWSLQPGGKLLFTDNESNNQRLFGQPNTSLYVKDGINNYVVKGDSKAVNPDQVGTKAAVRYTLHLAAGEKKTVRLRLSHIAPPADPLGKEFERIFNQRRNEADEFYDRLWAGKDSNDQKSQDLKKIQRQAFAGMLWSKQYYHYVAEEWLQGDPTMPPPPKERLHGRNSTWDHLYNSDILSIPDKWEYPWFAAWDLAFHAIPLTMVDPEFAKRQLDLLTREWYMHPNGQLPAYEWDFGDVNPPVHAWATWRVYKIDKKINGHADRAFLERVFQKLLLNFTWWVNRKDEEGKNIFQGGFLGLDNIGVFDRSAQLPMGGHLEQSDGTSWMAMYSLNMLAIALELAKENPVYEDIATKFFEHFLYIVHAMNHMEHGAEHDHELGLWDEKDGFFYDVLHLPNGQRLPMRIRSMVGLIPLFAIETLEIEDLFKTKGFFRRFNWFMKNRPDLTMNVTCHGDHGMCERRILTIATPEQLKKILGKMLDENEFLSPYGIRALSRFHQHHPFTIQTDGHEQRIDYEPGESTNGLFGGNSNWRGPIWFPVNFLLIESLQKYHHYFGDEFKVECPTGSGRFLNLLQVADEISNRLIRIFQKDDGGRRPVFGSREIFQSDPLWNQFILFHEYFHGDNGSGVGASHQTGWTGLVAKLIQQQMEGTHRSQAISSLRRSSVVSNL